MKSKETLVKLIRLNADIEEDFLQSNKIFTKRRFGCLSKLILILKVL